MPLSQASRNQKGLSPRLNTLRCPSEFNWAGKGAKLAKKNNEKIFVTVHGSKVQGFKGCILITLSHFVSFLYVKTNRFHIPTNLEHGTWQ
jgi:hypothetical protein